MVGQFSLGDPWWSCARFNVLVQAEQIAGVVLGFDLREAFIVHAVGRPHPRRALVLSEIVDIDALLQVGLRGLPLFARPGGDRSGIGRIHSHTDRQKAVLRVAVAEGRTPPGELG